MEKMKLLFRVPVFSRGLNVTVRRGVKWDLVDKNCVPIADVAEPDRILMGRDISTKVMRFCDILDSDIAHEHDPDAGTPEGLMEAMLAVYPGFDDHEIVTVVSFWV